MVRPLRLDTQPRPVPPAKDSDAPNRRIALAAVAWGPVRAFVGELPVGRAQAAVVTLAAARDPLPDGGRLTACVEGRRVPIAYRAQEPVRAVALRLALALERRLGPAYGVRLDAAEPGAAAIHVARIPPRIGPHPRSPEAALDRLAALLGPVIGVAGLVALPRAVVVYAEGASAAGAVRRMIPGSSFLGWPVEITSIRPIARD